MKSAKDPRHRKRRKIVKELFANTFIKQKQGETAGKILRVKDKLDAEITRSAPAWPIDKLNRIDLSILRLATYELSRTDTPPKVVIDEAVELAKEFGGENSPSFVNGVLGNILTNLGKNTDEQETTKD